MTEKENHLPNLSSEERAHAVSGQAGNPAEKAWERVRRHPLFHAFSALALIEYQCSPAKAALRVARFGKWVLKVHSSGLFTLFHLAPERLSEP